MIYKFNIIDVPNLAEIGGKAKALIETTKAGFPVPEGLVLAVSFFDEWLQNIKGSDGWQALLTDTTKVNCDRVKAEAAGLRFTTGQRRAFDEQVKGLAGDLFAIRSSSPEEDLKGNSFAGMYETLLGVTRPGLEEAVAKAFSSCFDFRVTEYKKQNNIDLSNTCIAVIVQHQIASDVSGVGFSLNPLNNAYDEVVINASFGLGETIVSGSVTPDIYIFDSVKNSIVEKQINEKSLAFYLKMDGGIAAQTPPEPQKQALADLQIIELAALVKEGEKYYRKPIDIEWAYQNGKLYLLQARPITTYLPLFPELVTKPGEDKLLYLDVIGMTQGFTDSMSVLGTELWADVLQEIKGETLVCSLDGTMPTLHGRQYLNISYIYKAMGKKIAGKMLSIYDDNVKRILSNLDIAEYLPSKLPQALKGMKLNAVGMALKYLPFTVRAIFGDYRKAAADYLEVVEGIKHRSDNFNYQESFSQTVDEAIKDIGKIVNTVGIILSGMLAFGRVKRMFKGYDIKTEVTALGMDLDGNPTSEMGHLMFKLASYDEFQNTPGREQFINKLNNESYSNQFRSDFKEFIDKYGVRGFKEIDVASKRAYEDIGSVYDRLAEINIDDSQIAKVIQKRQEAYDRLYSIAKEGGFEKRFAKQAEIYQGTYGYREHPKYVIVYVLARLHDLSLRIGERFAAEGRLENANQVFDLHKSEITRAQRDSRIDLQKLRGKNLAPYKVVGHIKDWPLVIDSRGKIFKPELEIKDGDLVGTAIAPGKVRGKAKVLHSPYEKPLYPGEILVTTSAEPSWTPIFINAAGVVMEIGGMLQHGGIIAREYGIPCVSGLLGLMDIVKDGDLLEVDGSNGVVKLISVDHTR